MKDKKAIGIDLFSGAGGMSLGAENAGIEVQVAIEADKSAAETYVRNHKHTRMICDDIRNIDANDLQIKTDLPVIVFGGPPCQGFSSSNKRTSNKDNEKNWLFEEFIRFIRDIKPDWVVLENVTGLASTEGGFFYNRILEKIDDLGYTNSPMILTASDYGVPQNRNRLFIIASRENISIRPPEPKKGRKITVGEALCDLPLLNNGASKDLLPYRAEANNTYARKMRGRKTKCTGNLVSRNAEYILERYVYIGQGENWEAIPEALMSNYKDRSRCHTGVYRRLKSDEPSVVIGNYRKNMLIHPEQNRGLSVREAARIQSFPDKFEFCGNLGLQQQQVGNAVPPLLAEAVFKTVISAT